MVQFSAMLKSILSNSVGVDFAKDDRDLVLTSSGVIDGQKSENFAAAHSKRGKKGLNQDRFIVWEEFGRQEDNMVFCGVFDGHGPWGHHTAKTVRHLFPTLLLRNWQELVSIYPNRPNHNVLVQREDDSKKHTTQLDIWKQCYYKTCAEVDQELEHHPRIDSLYSGTTALALVRQGDHVIIANVGDSRAVLATISDDGNLVGTQLTTDLKPNLPDERDRISRSRGRVYSCPDEPGVHRVWKPNGPKLIGPGLAVSRAFGDYFIKDFGLTSEPVITHRCITSRDQFVILATDGLWDVVSNREAVEIVFSTPERESSAKRLVERAVCAWKRRGRGGANVMDDISVICLFLRRLNS